MRNNFDWSRDYSWPAIYALAATIVLAGAVFATPGPKNYWVLVVPAVVVTAWIMLKSFRHWVLGVAAVLTLSLWLPMVDLLARAYGFDPAPILMSSLSAWFGALTIMLFSPRATSASLSLIGGTSVAILLTILFGPVLNGSVIGLASIIVSVVPVSLLFYLFPTWVRKTRYSLIPLQEKEGDIIWRRVRFKSPLKVRNGSLRTSGIDSLDSLLATIWVDAKIEKPKFLAVAVDNAPPDFRPHLRWVRFPASSKRVAVAILRKENDKKAKEILGEVIGSASEPMGVAKKNG